MKQTLSYACILVGGIAMYGINAQAKQTTPAAKAAAGAKAPATRRVAPTNKVPVARAAVPTVRAKVPTVGRAPARTAKAPVARKTAAKVPAVRPVKPRNDPAGGTAGSLLNQVLASGVVRVCVRTDVPPFGFLRGRMLQGFDLALAEELVTQLGIRFQKVLKVNWVVINAAERVSSLQSGRCDVVAAAFSKTASRAKKVSFSDVYYSTKKVLLKRAGDVSPSPIVARVRTTTQGKLGLKGATFTSFLTYRDVLYTMRQKLVDYVVADKPIGLYLTRRSGGAYRIHRYIGQSELYCLGIAKKSTELRKELNRALGVLTRSGRLAHLRKKWLQ